MTRRVLKRFSRRERGSVLIVALLFAAVIAISLGSFLRLAISAAKLADRSFYGNAARNLVDLGLEQALWSLNHNLWTEPTGFSARSGYTGQYQATFPTSSTYYSLSGGVKAQVKVWIDTAYTVDGVNTPHVVAEATVLLGAEPLVTKEAELYIKRRAIADQSLVARSGLVLDGNINADSWNSMSDTPSTADDVIYSTAVRHAELRVAAASIEVGTMKAASIYGYAVVDASKFDASNPTGVSLGDGGLLSGEFGAVPGVDRTRVTSDFTTNFPDIPSPSASGYDLGVSIITPTTLPRLGDSPASDGVYYYQAPAVALAGSASLDIGPATVDATHLPVKVVLTLMNTIGNAVQTTDGAAINVGPQSNLSIYTSGNVAIAGAGVVNGGATPNNPDDFHLYGTRIASEAAGSGMQVISITGVPYLSAVIYTPNGNVTANCATDIYGAIVGDHVTLVGDCGFHGDESLKRKSSLGVWGPTKWRELTSPTDRAAYADQLAF